MFRGDLDLLNPDDAIVETVSGNIVLEEAAISNEHSGFFAGEVTGNIDGENFNGNWGGQFYGNNDSDGIPESVAGTMAAESNLGSIILMPWVVDKEP